jgi:hypothetical protein
VYRESYFRGSKAYVLANKDESQNYETIVKKLRSIPRKHHESLSFKHFSQDPRQNSGVVRGFTMGPSAGMEILMSWQSKALAKSFNLTRFMTVR